MTAEGNPVPWDAIMGTLPDEDTADVPSFAYTFAEDEHLRERPFPGLLVAGDRGLFYSDKTNWIYGAPDSCKSWLAGKALVEHAEAGGVSVMIDAEDSPAEFAFRMHALGATGLLMAGRIVYIEDDDMTERRDEVCAWALAQSDPLFVVIDSATETGAGQDIDAITQWKSKYLAGWPDNTGFLVVDHLTKADESTHGDDGNERVPTGPFGSQNKKALVRGSLVFARETGEGAWRPDGAGSVKLMVQKDKPGGSFKRRAWSVAARGEPMSGGRLDITLSPYDGSGDTDALEDRIADYVRGHPTCARTEIQTALGVPKNEYPRLRETLDTMVVKGALVHKKDGNANRYKIKEEQT